MWLTGVLTYHPVTTVSASLDRALKKHGLFYLHCHHPGLFLFHEELTPTSESAGASYKHQGPMTKRESGCP